MAAAEVLMEDDDVPMPWEYDICQYHKHEVTPECERKHVVVATQWEFDGGSPGVQAQQPRRSPRSTDGAQWPSDTHKSSPQKPKNAQKLAPVARGKLKAVKRKTR
jgi:hypothetical protein